MINKTISIGNAKLTSYILEDGEFGRSGIKRDTVIICPGGGYTMVSKNEGEPVALFFNSIGYHAFVLEYSVKINNPFPKALVELAQAMNYVRKNSNEFLVDENKISVVGFSAGGNLALSLGAYAYEDVITSKIGLSTKDVLPYRIILGYPTVTLIGKRDGEPIPDYLIELIEKKQMPDFRGPSVYEILLGKENPTKEEINSLNLLNKIHDNMPPIFVFGTFEDSVIPVSDLADLCKKMYEKNRPCELHLFQKGNHGMSVANKAIYDEEVLKNLSLPMWKDLLIKWLEQEI